MNQPKHVTYEIYTLRKHSFRFRLLKLKVHTTRTTTRSCRDPKTAVIHLVAAASSTAAIAPAAAATAASAGAAAIAAVAAA